jgi:hypothetical protein
MSQVRIWAEGHTLKPSEAFRVLIVIGLAVMDDQD